MASDGKGNRKHRKPLCPKCNDCGWLLRWGPLGVRGGHVVRIRCRCAAGKRIEPTKKP